MYRKRQETPTRTRLEALAVDNGGARLVVLGLGDPHGLEGREGGEDRATDPDGVLALRGSDDLDLHGLRGEGGDFLGHALGDTLEHGGTTREDGVAVEILADIDVALHDGIVSELVDTRLLHTNEGRLEEDLGAAETLVADGDDLAIREFVGLLDIGGLGSLGHLGIEVEGNVAELLLDVTDDFTFGRGGEGVATLGQDLHHVVSEITASEIETENGVGEGITFVDGDSVGDTITSIQDDTSGTAGGVEGQDGLDTDVHGGGVEGLEHDLGHLLTVGLGVEGGLSEEDGMLLGGDTELVVEGVVPDLLHIVPVGDDTVLNGVLEGQDTTLGLSLITDVGVLLAHADHDTWRRARTKQRDQAQGREKMPGRRENRQTKRTTTTRGSAARARAEPKTENPVHLRGGSTDQQERGWASEKGRENRPWWRGRPTMEGKTARGASSPAKPALHIPAERREERGEREWAGRGAAGGRDRKEEEKRRPPEKTRVQQAIEATTDKSDARQHIPEPLSTTRA